MDDGGISITGLTIGGAALTTVGGLIGAWLKARHSRMEITPQPLEVRESLKYSLAEDCQRHQHHNELAHENLFARMAAVEKEQARTSAKLEMVLESLNRIENKIDRRMNA
jgi:hypothetical protein